MFDAAPAETVDPVDRLVDNMIAMTALHGLDRLSLRTIAERSGCSTAYIFQKFGNKRGLLRASVQRALAWDEGFHAALAQATVHAPRCADTVADLVAHYVAARAESDAARFLSWCVLSGDRALIDFADLRRWHDTRLAFWRTKMADEPARSGLVETLVSYVTMEEFYGTVLHRDVRYTLLLRETIRALLRLGRGAAAAAHATSLAAATAEVPRGAIPRGDADAPTRQRLLQVAADTILHEGVEALNQRRVARAAAASSSAVTYYFGDMKSFVGEAIWGALIRDVPPVLDPLRQIEGAEMTLEQWFTRITRFLRPRRGAEAAGFYTSFARLTAQTCLLAASWPDLVPLVTHLRALEGWGTYRASRHVAQATYRIDRDHAAAFGIWIKGEAVLRDVGVIPGAITAATVTAGAALIFPRA